MNNDHNAIKEMFDLIAHFHKINDENSPGLVPLPQGITDLICKIISTHDLKKIYDCGTIDFNFAPSTITNLIILHGGYFKLLKSGVNCRRYLRFVDSLYQPSFINLKYNTINKDIIAPWVTLSAQEVLLDIGLKNYVVVEYGSGVSTFFFTDEAKETYSFEDNGDKSYSGDWESLMKTQSENLGKKINIIRLDNINSCPEIIVESLSQKNTNLLVFIDGCNRVKHFTEWSEFIIKDKSTPILLLVDNSELAGFENIFNSLNNEGACIYHHYGFVYGGISTKQCSSFITFNPKLMHGNTAAPYQHDQRWGCLNFQD